MYDIKKEFDDIAKPSGKSRFYVNADKLISPFNKELYPIKFSGFINGEKVEFTLKNSYSQDIQNYTFETFPSTYEHLKNEIPDWIDHFLNDSMK